MRIGALVAAVNACVYDDEDNQRVDREVLLSAEVCNGRIGKVQPMHSACAAHAHAAYAETQEIL